MEGWELVAAHASSIELVVEHYYVPDSIVIHDYHGPQLIVLATQARVVTITNDGRQVFAIDPHVMNALVELALAACDEPQPSEGPDTADGRPITSFRLRAYRALHELARDTKHRINHYAARALRPAYSRFLTALRAASGKLPREANNAWDLAATWMAPLDLGELWRAGQPIPLPSIVNVIADDDTVYFRAGQPPQRSELYRLDPDQLMWLRANEPPMPLTTIERGRWVLPCGGGIIETHQEWQEPRRIYVRIDDPARGIYVQRA